MAFRGDAAARPLQGWVTGVLFHRESAWWVRLDGNGGAADREVLVSQALADERMAFVIFLSAPDRGQCLYDDFDAAGSFHDLGVAHAQQLRDLATRSCSVLVWRRVPRRERRLVFNFERDVGKCDATEQSFTRKFVLRTGTRSLNSLLRYLFVECDANWEISEYVRPIPADLLN